MSVVKTKRAKSFVRSLLSASLVMISFSSFSSSIQQADIYFEKHEYVSALNEYLSIVETKNSKAYYQLGVMHYKGFGVEADSFKALVWFSMAAEENYENSEEIVSNLIANVEPHEKSEIDELIKKSQLLYKHKAAYQKHKPMLNIENFTERFTFGEYSNISEIKIYSEEGSDYSLSMFMANQGGGSDIESFEGLTDYNTFESENELTTTSPYFLIADYDIYPDGSIRNIVQVKTKGFVDLAENNLAIKNLPKPTFKDQQVHFINRTYLGVANYNRFKIRREYYRFYKAIKASTRKLSESEKSIDQYNYAMALMNFPWLKPEDGKVDELLENAAKNGYTLAKYEYGLRLYREQKDINEAINWIFEAAKDGLSQGQYRLARTLLDSPWVIKNEVKALFWLEEAASQDHIIAKQKTAEMKLLAENKDLHDIKGAMVTLAEISETQEEDPQYHYLQAMAHSSKEERELSKAVKYIKAAISKGKSLNWNTDVWQQQLKNWTSGGSVTIQD